MKYFFTLLFLTFYYLSFGQSTEERLKERAYDSLALEAHHTVKLFFEYMNNSDTAMLRSIVHPDIKLLTTYTDKEGKPQLHEDEFNDFLSSIASIKGVEWQEKIDNVQVQRDGNLVQVWMDYTFIYKGVVSHCGVNTMQLFYDGSNWKVIYIADTRRKRGCK